jgi:hypothetical protein
MGNISVYTRCDLDQIFLRTKGGASRQKIKTSDSFVRTHELKLNKEWRACSTLKHSTLLAKNTATTLSLKLSPTSEAYCEGLSEGAKAQRH